MSYPPRMREDPWIGEEPTLAAVVLRVAARALRRRRRVLAVALAAAAVLLAARAIRAPTYEAAVYFHLAESDVTDPSHAPQPERDVSRYIESVALSRRQLERIMRNGHVADAALARDPVAAVDDFREQIKVEVSRNYFIQDRRRRDEPRSAYVTISLLGSDGERTRAMLHEIRDAILADQAERRGGSLAATAGVLETELAQARARVASLQQAMERLGAEAERADRRSAIDVRAQIATLRAETETAIDRVVALERRASDVEFSGAAEGEQLGLAFELLDESLTTFAPRLGLVRLALYGLALLGIAILLAAPVVGAFDDRIYAPADLASWRLPLVGAFPGFAGDDAGTYRQRAGAGCTRAEP